MALAKLLEIHGLHRYVDVFAKRNIGVDDVLGWTTDDEYSEAGVSPDDVAAVKTVVATERAKRAGPASPAAANVWLDVTGLVHTAAEALAVGSFVAVENFSLFDSMSALELMDPKMDPPGAEVKPVDVAALLASGALPLERLTLAEARALSLQLLVLEFGWCEGVSLAESVFTCLYLHPPALPRLVAALADPSAGPDPAAAKPTVAAVAAAGDAPLALRALAALGVIGLKVVHLTREAVFHADLYEEEDFSPGLHDFDLATKVPEAAALSALDRLDRDLRAVAAQVRLHPRAMCPC
jgi:hypothetical protein